MLEFGKFIEDLNYNLKKSREGYEEGIESFYRAEQSFIQAKEIREQMLQDILSEKGLAVCGRSHSIREDGDIKNLSAKDFGIYPKNEMRLLYYEDGPRTIRDEYHDSTHHSISLQLLCPEHFPENRKWYSSKSHDYTLILSEVVIKEEKYILLVDGSDISSLVSQKPRGWGKNINPEGEPSFLIDNAIYKYYGIPDLPQKPRLDNVKYGK